MKRRVFLEKIGTIPILGAASGWVTEYGRAETQAGRPRTALQRGSYHPGRIPNEYNLYLSGEREALRNSPHVVEMGVGSLTCEGGKRVRVGESIDGWRLLIVLPWLNGEATAVFEKHVTHQGAIAYVTPKGEVAHIPKRIGELSSIRPRPVNTPNGVRFERPSPYIPGPDVVGEYILNSAEDPCYENVAALGAEMIGWTLVGNEEGGAEKSLWLEADGTSRQMNPDPQLAWAPDHIGRLFDPSHFLPEIYRGYSAYPAHYTYEAGYSKRTLLGGYAPAADIGVWNPKAQAGYEVMMVMPPGADARPIARLRVVLPPRPPKNLVTRSDDKPANTPGVQVEKYWNGSAEDFFSVLAGVWNKWHHFFEDRMKVEIPDEWLLDGARAGIVLSRCSYHGLEPTYQIGEGAYTKIPVRSHALFPVAHYEFVWAHQLWNLTEEVEPYFEHYLDNYILPDGNFLYNTQDQVEAPLNVGVFLEDSARTYDYNHDIAALRKRLPPLRRMIDHVLWRYRYTKSTFPADDPRHGLIWGSAEADNGDPADDFPESHVYYYENASWIWRGLKEHSRCLQRAGTEHQDNELSREGAEVAQIAAAMRADVERSLNKTLADRNPEMKKADIPPIFAFDTDRKPTELTSYENHRYISDWWLSDWGNPEIDEGHFRHRTLAGLQILGMNVVQDYPITAGFMEHGTLAGRIRQDDYRPFLLTLYGNMCYAMDSGNRYAPEDSLLPGNFPGEGNPYAWSAVVNSELQPTLGLRWLLCYEEHDQDVVHLQKAAPRHWFSPGEKIRVQGCPTRSGSISWVTEALSASQSPRWRVEIEAGDFKGATLAVHIHPADGQPLKTASLGEVRADRVILTPETLAGKTRITLEIT
ncbi:MAG: hypothetical protein ABSH52_17440 [Terriglobia bacterium]